MVTYNMRLTTLTKPYIMPDLDESVFLKRWGCSFISRTEDPVSYVARFPCPRCGSDAYEIFLMVSEPSEAIDRKLDLNGYALWVIRNQFPHKPDSTILVQHPRSASGR